MNATMLEPEIVMQKGNPISVITSIEEYDKLLERVEDSENLASLKASSPKAAGLPPA